MNLQELKPRLLAVAVLAVITSSAFASVDTTGTPDLAVSVLRTYGVDVPTRAGLKTIVPQGWTLLIHKSANLPQTISWKPDEPWTAVLDDLSAKNNLAVRMDWATKTVTVMSPEVAAQQKAKETEILQAAKTPLPSLAPESTKPATATAKTDAVAQVGVPPIIKQASPSAAVAAPAAASPSSKAPLVDQLASLKQMAATQPSVSPTVAATPALAPTVAPAAAPVAVAQAPVQAAVQPRINPPVAQPSVAAAALAAQSVMPRNVAASQVGGSMKDLLAQVAARYGYILSWEAPDVEIPGAVTLLGVDVGEDARLLQKAMGMNSTPVSIQVYRSSSVIRVVPRSRGSEAVAILESPYNGPVSAYRARASAPAPVYAENGTAPTLTHGADLNVATVNVGSSAASAPQYRAVADTHVAPVTVKLTVLKGESLANSLKTFFMSQGWDLQWKATSDLQADYPVALEGADGKEVMKKLLPHLGLVADFYTQSKTVVIRNSDSTLN
jgi:hypothetical protein